MIQTNSRLPWKEKLSKSGKKYQILDFNNNIIIDDIRHLGDAMYIEEACNNYPKAIELLNRIYEDNKSYINDDEPSLELEIKDFLKQL